METVKEYRNNLRKTGTFYTPDKLLEYLKPIIERNKKDYTSVLDFNCGAGSLFKILKDGTTIYGADINEKAVEYCKTTYPQGNFKVVEDSLNTEFEKSDIVLINPPFSLRGQPSRDVLDMIGLDKWSGVLDLAWQLKALQCVKDDGLAICINSMGTTYVSNSMAIKRAREYSKQYLKELHFIEGGEFEDTSIPVCIWVLSKEKQNQFKAFKNDEIKTFNNDVDDITSNVLFPPVEVDKWKDFDSKENLNLLIEEKMKNIRRFFKMMELANELEEIDFKGIFINKLKEVMEELENASRTI